MHTQTITSLAYDDHDGVKHEICMEELTMVLNFQVTRFFLMIRMISGINLEGQ